jgi:hypothetical protein
MMSPADEDVVEVGDHEVGVVLLEVGGEAACIIPLIPPMVNSATMAMANIMDVVNRSVPPHMVASQLNTFTPVGMAMIMVLMVKKASAMGPRPVVNMWWDHTPQLMKPMSTPLNTMMA